MPASTPKLSHVLMRTDTPPKGRESPVPFRPRKAASPTRQSQNTSRLSRLDPALLDRQSLMLVTLLAENGAYASDGMVAGMVTVIGRKSGVSLALLQAPLHTAERLCKTLWLKRENKNAGRFEYRLTPLAQQALTLKAAPLPPTLPPESEAQVLATAHGSHPRFNPKESPLMWLARRRNSRGVTHISATQFMAGERLRRDYTQAGLTPAMSANWSGLPVAASRNQSRLHETERMLDARQRLRAALSACSTTEANLLLDLCCFLKPLEQVEKAYGFRSRSGKHRLSDALTRLARHYGLSEHAQGPKKSPAILVWKA